MIRLFLHAEALQLERRIDRHENMICLGSACLVGAGFVAGGGDIHESRRILMDPSAIAGIGLDVVQYIFGSISFFDIPEAITLVIVALITMFSYFAIAWQAILALIEFYVVVSVSGILLPFGLVKSSRFLGEKVLGAVVAHGIKLMVIAFILAAIDQVMRSIVPSQTVTLNEALSILFCSVMMTFLVSNIPGLVAGFLSG